MSEISVGKTSLSGVFDANASRTGRAQRDGMTQWLKLALHFAFAHRPVRESLTQNSTGMLFICCNLRMLQVYSSKNNIPCYLPTPWNAPISYGVVRVIPR